MIKSILTSLIIIFFAFQLYSQNSISLTDSLDIMKVMKFQENAWNSGDINSFMQGYIKSD
ncbi:MAG: DUF4440 domain-containing protein, partial [Flavobacteriaceae bacterium]|nr:DUF4440 domain-containing protein [Flavobacteriaceae bacterium]